MLAMLQMSYTSKEGVMGDNFDGGHHVWQHAWSKSGAIKLTKHNKYCSEWNKPIM